MLGLPSVGAGGGSYQGASDSSSTVQTDEFNVNASQNYGPLDSSFFGDRGRGRPGMAGAAVDSLWIVGAAAALLVALVLLKKVS